jgi:hypothetical protein
MSIATPGVEPTSTETASVSSPAKYPVKAIGIGIVAAFFIVSGFAAFVPLGWLSVIGGSLLGYQAYRTYNGIVDVGKRPVPAAIMGIFAMYMVIGGLLLLPAGLVLVGLGAALAWQARRVYQGARDTVRRFLMVWWGVIGVASLIFTFVGGFHWPGLFVAAGSIWYVVYLVRGGRWLFFMV